MYNTANAHPISQNICGVKDLRINKVKDKNKAIVRHT